MTKKEALGIVFSCAPLYKKNLVDQSLLFVTTDKHKEVHCLEVTFDTSNFLHMTGFKLRKPGINARHFFNLCYDKRLTESDFDFASDGTTEMKMRVLPSLMKKNLSAKMLGDYCMNAQADTIASSHSRSSGAARSDVARLKGARFVTLEEGDQGAMLDEGLVKQMTGGNTITARFQYGKEFEFRPEFKLLEATNHLPKIRGTDVGIWRRIRLVPFTQRIPEDKQDMLLPQKLEAELPGILNWALGGLQKWLANSQGGKRHGLPPCAAVDSAVNAYKQDQDRIAAFLADCTEPAEDSAVQASVLFRTYLNWCSENNEKWRMANKQFGMEVKKHYEIRKGMYYNEYVGMTLSDEGMRCMALARGTEPSVAPVKSSPLYEQTRLKN